MTTLSGSRSARFDNGVEQSYTQWPSVRGGDIESAELQETTPAVVDPDTLEEITPAVVEMVVIDGPRPLNADELAAWDVAADDDDRKADKVLLRDDLQGAKDVRDEAAQSRVDMDPAAPINRWVMPDGSGSNGDRITELESIVADLVTENRRQYGDIHTLSAMLVRKFRADRDDE